MMTKVAAKFGVSALLCLSLVEAATRPHIIIIVADDLGWNDVGFHGSNQIPTPNIDALAFDGTILHNYYVNPICTPSRSALMTGLHPIHTGMQSGVLVGAAPYALPLSHKLMPQILSSELGYKAHGVGKWHLGSHRAVYTPTQRGFLSHVGYWTGHEDYYDHTAQELYKPVEGWGYDFRRNMSVAWDDYGTYATDIFTQEAVKIIQDHNQSQPLFLYLAHLAVHSANSYRPLQAPSEVVNKFAHIKDQNRRTFAAMMYKLDESVGAVVSMLQKQQMLQDSIIVFTTDNGGPAGGFNLNAASNWPLRGVKSSLWEGAVRGAGFLWSPLLKTKQRVSHQMMNVQDWLPTLFTGAGGDPDRLPFMDGMSLWDALSEDSPSPRNLMLHNIDDKKNMASLRVAEWKFTRGTIYSGEWDDWYEPSGREGIYNASLVAASPVTQALKAIGRPMVDEPTMLALRSQTELACPKSESDAPCNLVQQVCLFNITADPCERNNLAFKYPDVIKMMEDTLETFNSTAIPPGNKPVDPRGDPKYFDYTWTNWLDFYEPKTEAEILREEALQVELPDLKWRDLQIQFFVQVINGIRNNPLNLAPSLLNPNVIRVDK